MVSFVAMVRPWNWPNERVVYSITVLSATQPCSSKCSMVYNVRPIFKTLDGYSMGVLTVERLGKSRLYGAGLLKCIIHSHEDHAFDVGL